MHKPQNDPPGSVIHSNTNDVEQSPPPSDQPGVRATNQQQTASASSSKAKQKGSSAQRRNSTTSRDSTDGKPRPSVKRSSSSRGIKKSSSKRDLKRSDSKRKIISKGSKESKITDDEAGDKKRKSSLQRTSSSKGLRKSSSKRNLSTTSESNVSTDIASSLSKSASTKQSPDVSEDKSRSGVRRSGSSRALKKSSSKRDMKRSDSKRKLKSIAEPKEPRDQEQRPGVKRSSSSKGLKKSSSKRELKKSESKRKLNKSSNSLQQSSTSLKKQESSSKNSKKVSSKASEERCKPTRTKSATASTKRSKPSRTLSTPVMSSYDASSQALGLDSIPESNNHSQSTKSRSSRIESTSNEVSTAATQPASKSTILPLSILVDTAIGHGERMKIVPGIEIYDESEDEADSFLDEEDDAFGQLHIREDRSLETPVPRQIGQKLSHFKIPMTPGGLVSLSTSSASSRLESPHVGVADSPYIQTMEMTASQRNTDKSILSTNLSNVPTKDHMVGHDSMTSSGGKLSEGSIMSGDSLAQNIFRELDGESTNGMMSMSSQEQNWAWLQSTLEQQEEEIMRQQHNDPPRAPIRQKSGDRLELQSMRVHGEKPRRSKETGMSRRQRGGESPTESVPPSRQKSGEAPIERRRSNSSSSSALERRLSGGPVKVVKSSDISALSSESIGQLNKAMEVNRSARRRNSGSSLRSQNSQDDTISGSDHLPDSNLADQNWMEHEDADSSSATDDFNEQEIFGTCNSAGGNDDEDAYARQYIQRMQEQRMQPQRPVERVDRKAELLARMGMAKKSALAQQPGNTVDSSDRQEETYRSARLPGQGDEDSNYVPKGYMGGNSSHMAPTTPVVSKASFMPGNQQEMDDYGITPKATNITGVYKASALKHPQLEDLQESFTDLHIGVMSSEASVANSSLSASMTSLSLSLDDRRRFAHAHDSMKDDSVRSSFNHSLTYINEELELTGEQLEMLELGSKVSRSKKGSKYANYYNDDAVSSFDDTAGGMRDSGSNDRSTGGSGTSGSNATTLSSFSTNENREQSNEITNFGDSNPSKNSAGNVPDGNVPVASRNHQLYGEDNDSAQSSRRAKPLYSSDDEDRGKSRSPTADSQAKLKAALQLHADVKQDFASGFDLKSVASAQVSTSRSHHSGGGDSNNSSRHSVTGSSENSSAYEAIYGKNEMPNIEVSTAHFVQVNFGTSGEVKYADNSTVLEEATAPDDNSVDDGMPTLEDFGEDDELAEEEYGGKRRQNLAKKDGDRNGTLGLFRSKRADMDESARKIEEKRRKSLDHIDELTKSTGTNSVMDRLFKFRKGSTRKLMAGSELADDSEVSFSSHHSL